MQLHSMDDTSESMESVKGPKEGTEPFHRQIVGDHPSPDDHLGFEEYVAALARFITAPQTLPPLTVSIEGVWGSGKTSFMRQLEDTLEKAGDPVIWFNPWRHEKAEEVWAAFMLVFLEEIRTAPSGGRQLIGSLRLLRRRLDESQVKWDLAWKTAVGAGVFMIGVLTVGALGVLDQLTLGHLQAVGLVGAGGGLFGALIWTQRTIDRTERQLKAYIDDPGYADRVPFIQRFHEDLEAILDAYVTDDRVFVFIDDLDRCAVPRAAELMQAINLMLAEDERLVFIIGMDREKVAAGIAAKHEGILDFLPGTHRGEGHEFGSDYLEKFVQIPFVLPRPDEAEVEEFIDELIKSAVSDDPSTGEPDLPQSIPGWDRETIKEVTVLVAPYLEYNPRKLKKFVNLYRLRAHLADAADLFTWQAYGERSRTDLTLQQLGKFVAATVQWPTITNALAADNDLLHKLIAAGEDPDSVSDPSPRFESWREQDGLIELLRAVPEHTDESTAMVYNLETVDVSELLQISPQLSDDRDSPPVGESIHTETGTSSP